MHSVPKAKGNLPTSPRSRLLVSAKTLFSRRGYEAASTSAIATQAKTSESQLMRLFGGKRGLLDSMFDETWTTLNNEIHSRLQPDTTGLEAVQCAFEVLAGAFRHDPEIATLFLFEGRRIRGHSNEIAISSGSLEFLRLFRSFVRRGQNDGSFRNDLSDIAITSVLMGAGEGLLRDRLTAERNETSPPFDDATMLAAFSATARGFS